MSGSGKTTIAQGVEKLYSIEVLEGDALRKGLCRNLGFTSEDRNENLRRIAHLADYLNKYTDVLVSCITPYYNTRELICSICSDIKIIYIKASIEKCRKRDPKGLYAKAYCGEILNFTGIDDVYEEPSHPDLIIDTEKETPDQSIKRVVRFIRGEELKYELFIGRWQPFHVGHEYIIHKKLNEGKNVAIAVRDTPISNEDPYPTHLRIRMIKSLFKKEVALGRIEVFPIKDISSVNIGRNVGYKVNIIETPSEISTISGSEIRKLISNGNLSTKCVPRQILEVIKSNT